MMSDGIPALGLLVDLPLGLLMWAAVLRFLLTIFLKEDSRFVLLRVTTAMTAPLVRLISYITPAWVIDRIAPLWVVFGLFMIRYYLLPLVIGYDINGFDGMPMEQLLLSVRSEVGL